MIYVFGPKDRAKVSQLNLPVVNTTSIAIGEWSQKLSPFLLGPVDLYDGNRSLTMENGWQFSKVYKKHIGPDGNPAPSYFDWAKAGWLSKRASRYPMGKGAKPEYSYWAGEKLGYIEARKRIYVPLYSRVVAKTEAWKTLCQLHSTKQDLILWDFDGYDHRSEAMTLAEVLDSQKKMGHAFVLAMMLEEPELISQLRQSV